jgi:hypothetical protein
VLLPAFQELARQRPEGTVAVVDLRALARALVDGELLAQREILEREARAVGSECADESQKVQGEVHAGASWAALGSARCSRAVESKSR